MMDRKVLEKIMLNVTESDCMAKLIMLQSHNLLVQRDKNKVVGMYEV